MAQYWHEEKAATNVYRLAVSLDREQVRLLHLRSPTFFQIYVDLEDIPYNQDGLFEFEIDPALAPQLQLPTPAPPQQGDDADIPPIPMTPSLPKSFKKLSIDTPSTIDHYLLTNSYAAVTMNMHALYDRTPTTAFEETEKCQPKNYPLQIIPDIYHFMMAVSILTLPSETHVKAYVPKYFDFLQMANLALTMNSPYLFIYIASWYASPRDLAFLFTFLIRHHLTPLDISTFKVSSAARDPVLNWIYRLFLRMSNAFLPPIETLISIVHDERLINAYRMDLREQYDTLFYDLFPADPDQSIPANQRPATYPLYPQILYNYLCALDSSFATANTPYHSHCFMACIFCAQSGSQDTLGLNVLQDKCAQELAFMPCCHVAIHPTCMLSLLDFLSHHSSALNRTPPVQLWNQHPFLFQTLLDPDSLFTDFPQHPTPPKSYTCSHCHTKLDLRTLLLLGRNMELAFSPAHHATSGCLLANPMPIQENLHYSQRPLFYQIFSDLATSFYKTKANESAPRWIAPRIWGMTPSSFPVRHDHDFLFPLRH